ncbi:MAG TPA: YkgJ family cysteine cluster protein [Tepidisphaeraceae bacterium]|jgi:Fe-S-cluster containining protein
MSTLRLAILGSSPCHLCTAACCKQNGHAYAVLLEPHEHRKFAPFSIDAPIQSGPVRTIEKVLPYNNGRCTFLGPDGLCTIYEDRPHSCRIFECIKGYHPQHTHSEFLQRNSNVRQMLDCIP